jgi:VIT1/CCC1 family predicted Fe2+/Mn2+ transporter
MYVIRLVTDRTRKRALAKRIVDAAPEPARGMIAAELPPGIADITGPDELEAMRNRLRAAQLGTSPLLTRRDLLEAVAVFAVVVLATFPLVIPFLVFDDVATAMKASRAVAFGMLFLAGYSLGRHADHPHPLRLGVAMAVFGAVLILIVMALGG